MLLAVAAMVCCSLAYAESELECMGSGMCSIGHSSTWTGDIADSAAFHDMLKAVSYSKEIIFTSLASQDGTQPDPVWMDQVTMLSHTLTKCCFPRFAPRPSHAVMASMQYTDACTWVSPCQQLQGLCNLYAPFRPNGC